MPRAKLTITLPEDAWIGALSRDAPDTRFRVLAALPTDETGVGLVELSGEDLPALADRMRSRPEILSLDVLGSTEERMIVQFETDEPLLLLSVRESGLPLEPPVEIVDGRATVEITASREKLSGFGNQLEQFGMHFQVDFIRGEMEETQRLLTDRQRELIVTAVEEGYYDTPRRCSLTELAGELDMAKSTLSETLHRAEGTIISEFVSDLET